MRIRRRGRGSIGLRLMGGSLVFLAACALSMEEQGDSNTVRRTISEGIDSVDPARELFVTDVSVVDDPLSTQWNPQQPNDGPAGSWSFGRLIDNLVPETMRTSYGRSQFVLSWLKSWESNQTVNGFVIPARPQIRSQIIDPWRSASGCTSTDDRCVLDLAKAPFRLLAIVNRPDLRRVPSVGDPGQAGQGRFVFGVLGPTGAPLPFTVIFEYQLPITGSGDILTWAKRWHALSSNTFGASYNDHLQSLTRDFTKRNAVPSAINGSALLQLRTNEVALTAPWEMREFVLNHAGMLQPTTVKQEVDSSLIGTSMLGNWASRNASAILAGQHVIPSTWLGRPFLAAAAPVPSTLFWRIPGVSEEVRHAFAQATCSGCHKSETGTNFLHVRARDVGNAALLSGFLTDQLSPGGPRVADFLGLLSTKDATQVKNGRGRDHPEDGPNDH